MKKRVSKFIFSCAAVVCLVVGFSVSASADLLGGAGLLGSSLGSLNVDLLAGGSAGIAALAPWLNGDFSIVGALTGVADGYIKVGDESVIIDGVEYESIFLDPSMAAELHTQAFDFITQKAITSNSSGILATGAGYLGDLPIYNQSGTLKSQEFSSSDSYEMGSIIFSVVPDGAENSIDYATSDDGVYVFLNNRFLNRRFPVSHYISIPNASNFNIYYKAHGSNDWYHTVNFPLSHISDTYSADPFEYSYVSGQIDVDPLPATYGFQAFVPTRTLSQAGFSVGTYTIDGGIGTDAVIELIQLLDEIYGQEEILDAEFVDEIVPPVPPQPVDTPLGEVPYEDFLDTFGQSVYGKLDAISDGIDTVGQVIDGVGTDVIEAVDTAGQSVVEELEVIGGAIDTAGQSVVDSVEESTGILEEAIEAVEAKVDELVDSIAEVIEEIMTHPLDLFSAWLDRLPEIPAIKDIFDGIKRHVGIWHYVVEWLGCIGTFLAFFIGLFGDVAYCMVVPIYACVAGAICLAFYKRFAR